jgi:hypothetical protein
VSAPLRLPPSAAWLPSPASLCTATTGQGPFTPDPPPRRQPLAARAHKPHKAIDAQQRTAERFMASPRSRDPP